MDARENASKSRNSDENAGANQIATRRRIQFICATTSEVWLTFCIKFASPAKFTTFECGTVKASTTSEVALSPKEL